MRVKDVGDSHQRLLQQLVRRISRRLDAAFIDLPGADRQSIGIQLREGGREVVMELPEALLLRATGDAVSRETVRKRIKTGRDRMIERANPAFLSNQRSKAPRRNPTTSAPTASAQIGIESA